MKRSSIVLYTVKELYNLVVEPKAGEHLRPMPPLLCTICQNKHELAAKSGTRLTK